jgi:hypothetical protein
LYPVFQFQAYQQIANQRNDSAYQLERRIQGNHYLYADGGAGLMKNPNTIEDELDATRIKLFEETKDMTSNERIAYINDIAEQTLKKHGIKIVEATRDI